jgi:predicted lipid carrier protein YhbT
MLDDFPGMVPPVKAQGHDGAHDGAGAREAQGEGRSAAGAGRLPGIFRRLPLPPAAIVRPLLRQFMAGLLRRHPQMFERLGPYGETRFLIDPVDLSFVLLLVPSARAPRLEMHPRSRVPAWEAAVRGPILKLLEMAEGEQDGDALFFSREIVIEGDTSAVLALRNAIDDAQIDLLAEVEAVFGPLAPVLGRLRREASSLMRAAGRVRRLFGAPVTGEERGGAGGDAPAGAAMGRR